MSTLTMRPETWPAILISAARRSPIRARHGRHPDQAPNRMQNGGYVRACTMDSSHTK